jgi:magnesium-transporting ATPase (P-type)
MWYPATQKEISMPILIAFVIIALLTAGLFAVLKGDTFLLAALLVVLALVVLVVAPQVPAIMQQLQIAIDARLHVALR